MTGWMIFGGIAAFLLWILLQPIELLIRYKNGEIAIQARWFFLRYPLFPPREKKKKKRAEKIEEKKDPTPPGKLTEETDLKDKAKKKKVDSPPDKESRTLKETMGLIFDLLDAAKGGIRLFYRHLILKDLRFRLVVAREDAAQTAIAYGQMNGWVHGAYAALYHLIRMKKSDVLVQADYLSVGDRMEFSFRLCNRLLFALGAALSFGGSFLWKMFQKNQIEKKEEKNAQKEKENVA